MRYEGMEQAAREASTLLKAMSNERRLLILCHLSRGERSVGELCDLVDISQSALSQHLAKLRADGLVVTRREAQTIYYSLCGEAVQIVLDSLYGLYCEGMSDAPGPRAHATVE
ncbi:ArsR/SmtB family transcription factor [Rhodovibrio salinarum]|uniref:ArsR family transcriptional regulator n=1 Tax=Rhodovibrio salinarum TaxID=1087 RepID=A0A934QI92_9PROT|nr:metalloregulator ArsR/SmtB family transcription factor [Rhodovibrio salinarum]MBK1697267.1 ArsR family transcriptional regulator [Rhodovibrio salinarum]